MRAGRLVRLLSLLQARGLLTASQLAAELEVSQRTVLRDIESLSSAGVPVYAVRGKLGGFKLVDGYASELPSTPGLPWPAEPPARKPGAGPGLTRARIRLSPRGRRLALLLGRPPAVRIRRSASAEGDPPGWVQAWIPVESAQATVLDLLALGAEAEVLSPPDLREHVRQAALRIAELHAADPARPASG